LPPNIIKRCLVTKHADVEVSKQRSNYEYEQLSKRGTHARTKHVWYGCLNEQNIARQTREQKKCFKLFDQMFDGLQILSNTIKQHQTRWPNGKMFGHQTMLDGVWSSNISRLDRPFKRLLKNILLKHHLQS